MQTQQLVTTPFGQRTISLGMIATQMAASNVARDAVVQKWHVFRDIMEARLATDRGLAILDALLSFHPDAELAGDRRLVDWPSNEQLIARANGMSPATLRRHLANLVECGLIIRRNSPNGDMPADRWLHCSRSHRGGRGESARCFRSEKRCSVVEQSLAIEPGASGEGRVPAFVERSRRSGRPRQSGPFLQQVRQQLCWGASAPEGHPASCLIDRVRSRCRKQDRAP